MELIRRILAWSRGDCKVCGAATEVRGEWRDFGHCVCRVSVFTCPEGHSFTRGGPAEPFR